MQPTITPLDATLGAKVTGVDLAALDDSTWQVIEKAFFEYALLLFPGQHLNEEQQNVFGRRFGELVIEAKPISNAASNGGVLGPDILGYWILRGNEYWHHDSSFMPVAAKASILTAKIMPSSGGETEWADTRAAYDELDETARKRLANLRACHSNYYSHVQLGQPARTGEFPSFHPYGAPVRSLVKQHPVTGKRALYTGRHAYGIEGLTADESSRLLAEVIEAACQPPRTYKHRWQIGDLVVWDNLCVMHRVWPYDYSKTRIMMHTRIAGNPETEYAPTVADPYADVYEPLDFEVWRERAGV